MTYLRRLLPWFCLLACLKASQRSSGVSKALDSVRLKLAQGRYYIPSRIREIIQPQLKANECLARSRRAMEAVSIRIRLDDNMWFDWEHRDRKGHLVRALSVRFFPNDIENVVYYFRSEIQINVDGKSSKVKEALAGLNPLAGFIQVVKSGYESMKPDSRTKMTKERKDAMCRDILQQFFLHFGPKESGEDLWSVDEFLITAKDEIELRARGMENSESIQVKIDKQ
ncbi:hypothetical protein FOL47_007296 [Perkinsus chesapeaki]|uniref:Uncharacterized protein n=1 Tax=Perkinsus chesapeaki TaxID=330153 RepID=A0A7J6LLL7_PERCH|nr:hypothetical protein FOL47_007296 [Perkinsus chesapeaki]